MPTASPKFRLAIAFAMLKTAQAKPGTTVLVDAGAGLLGRLFQQGLVNESWVFVAPVLLGDERALPCVRGLTAEALTDGIALRLLETRRRGDDVILRYRVPRRAPYTR